MAHVGGYWRPLAAVARLLEELGELAESLARPAQDDDELASELADLWIITTALADQFLGEVAEPGTHGAAGGQLSELVAAAGQIARIVNYYDGPKTPRSLAGWPSLRDAVAELHGILAGVAQAHGVELSTAVADKLRAISVRDAARFARAPHDPSTAACLEQFRLIETTPWGTEVAQARLWGAPPWSAQSLASNVAAIVPTLTSFTRAALREQLEGYVVTGPPLESMELLADWAQAVLSELAGHDPQLDQHPRGGVDASGSEQSLMFNGVRLSATVLCERSPHILLRPVGLERPDGPR
jgi:hypothetical protein